MREDYRKTGKCDFEVGKEGYMIAPLYWALKKQSPYTDSINKGYCIKYLYILLLFTMIFIHLITWRIMRMREVGLLSKWYAENIPDARRCFRDKRTKNDRKPDITIALSLKSLSGAFLALLIGFLFSLIVFICEKITGSLFILQTV